MTQRPVYDVCIIGSGAGGGMAANVLTKAGANVVMLEAGPKWDASKDSAMMKWPIRVAAPRRVDHESARSASSTPASAAGRSTASRTPSAPGTKFDWWRARMLGGRTNHWGRISLRFGPDDFRGKSIDGLGDDWPIAYDDMKPYYDKVDRLIGVFGSERGAAQSARRHLPAAAASPRCYELLVKKAADKLERHLHSVAAVDPHQAAQRPAGVPLLRPVQPRLHGELELLDPRRADRRRRWRRGSSRSSPTRWRARSRSDADGLANGVSYIDKNTGEDQHVRAKIVVLAASACETARMLLNSKSSARSRTGSPTRAARWASTSPTPRAPASAGSSRRWWTTSRTTTTASAACTSTCRGGSTTRSSTSRAATTSKCGAGAGQPSDGFMGGIQRYPGGGGYGKAAQGGLPPVLRRDDRLRRPRRDDPERRVLLRDRPGRRSTSSAFRCCASTGSGRDHEINQVEAHAGDLPRR